MDGEPIIIHQQNSKNLFEQTRIQDIHQFEVICRVRPLSENQHVSDISINEEKSTITIVSQTKNLTKQFSFNKIYDESVTQKQFSEELSNKIFRYCRQSGKTALIFSYGVTNSGKTYSILGTEENPGLLPSIIQKIEIEFPQDLIRISAIQIYNDEFYSLKNKQKLCPRERGAFYQFDEYQPEQITKQSTSQMMKQYIVNRYQSDTKSNKKSSRSHAIFKIETDEVSMAIIDLAGSERINKAQTNAQETASINLSLLTLGKCIHAIRDRVSIPFRQSKLTRAIVEYFTPQSKIYMIAHINRSGEMFHENVNVLQYAAVSTQVKQLNPRFNYSIVKSAHKKIQSKSKSVLKVKDNKENSPKNKEDAKKQKVPKSAKLHKENRINDLDQKLKKIEQKNKQAYRRDKNKVMENYINRLKAQKEQFDFYLDYQFEKEDSKDLQFIQQLKKARYTSPERNTQINIQLVKAQSRIKLRKEILEQIERQKQNNQSDAFTEMGPSMRKCLEQSILRQRQTRSQKQPRDRQIVLNLDETEPNAFLSKSDQRVRQEIAKFQCTPNKGLSNDDEQNNNYIGKLWQKSKKIFASASDTFNNVVVEYIRSHSRKKQQQPKQRPKLAIQKQIQIYIQREKQKRKSQRASKEETRISIDVPSEVVKSQQSEEIKSEYESVKCEQSEILKPVKSRDVKSEVLQNSVYSDLHKGLQTQSTASEQQSLPSGNQSRDYTQKEESKNLAEIRQTQEFKSELNSPYFKNATKDLTNQSKQPEQINIIKETFVVAEQKTTHVTQNVVVQQKPKIGKVEVKQEQSVSSSNWDRQTSKGSNFSQKSKNNPKSKSRELKFYVEQPMKKKSISPLKTRSQRLKVSQMRIKY